MAGFWQSFLQCRKQQGVVESCLLLIVEKISTFGAMQLIERQYLFFYNVFIASIMSIRTVV